jgi:hypothetical protein
MRFIFEKTIHIFPTLLKFWILGKIALRKMTLMQISCEYINNIKIKVVLVETTFVLQGMGVLP